MTNPAPVASLEVDRIEGVVESGSVDAIYFNSCSFGSTAISYSVLSRFKLMAVGTIDPLLSSLWMCALPFLS